MGIKIPLEGRIEQLYFIMFLLMPTITHLQKVWNPQCEYPAYIQLFLSSPRVTNDNDTWFSHRYTGPSIR